MAWGTISRDAGGSEPARSVNVLKKCFTGTGMSSRSVGWNSNLEPVAPAHASCFQIGRTDRDIEDQSSGG